nr:MAG TPA: hypothetical protein [Caudoviricetes sp.]
MMERLTFEGNFCDIAQCDATPGSSYCESGSCTQRKVWERLKQFEDKCESTEVLAKAMDMEEILGDEYYSVDRMLELLKADKDGRLVVLPCKVGQRVFALLGTDKHISECEVKQIGMGNKIGFIGLEPIGARGREYGVSLNGFGKTVFLTREEAEKALEAMKDG